jgi:hypothetical protein
MKTKSYLLLRRSLCQHIPIPDVVDVNVFLKSGFVFEHARRELSSNFCSDGSRSRSRV